MNEAGGGDDRRSLAEAAGFFDVSVPTLKRWIEAGAPVAERGSNGIAYQISLRAMAEWRRGQAAAEADAEIRKREQEGQLRLELLGSGALLADDPGAAVLTPAQRAAAMAEELHRTKLAEKRRELVPFEDVALRLGEVLAQLRQRLRQIPDVAAPELGLTAAAAEHLAELVDTALADTADGIGALMREVGGAVADEAGAGAMGAGAMGAGVDLAPAGALL